MARTWTLSRRDNPNWVRDCGGCCNFSPVVRSRGRLAGKEEEYIEGDCAQNILIAFLKMEVEG
jgi:hypothetical protein